jgi:hypothetical protein
MTDIKTDSTINIEIGPGSTPLIGLLRDDLRGKGTAIFIDKEESPLKDIKEQADSDLELKIFELDKFNKIHSIQAQASSIPIPDNSCDSILAVNVLGHIKKRFTGRPSYPQANEMASEWFSKVKSGGKIIILETYTPDVNPKDKVVDLFQNEGFELKEEYNKNNLKSIFKRPSNTPGKDHFFVNAIATDTPGSYALVFEKK